MSTISLVGVLPDICFGVCNQVYIWLTKQFYHLLQSSPHIFHRQSELVIGLIQGFWKRNWIKGMNKRRWTLLLSDFFHVETKNLLTHMNHAPDWFSNVCRLWTFCFWTVPIQEENCKGDANSSLIYTIRKKPYNCAALRYTNTLYIINMWLQVKGN